MSADRRLPVSPPAGIAAGRSAAAASVASSELRPRFDAVVATALAEDPARRYRRAGDLAGAAAIRARRATTHPRRAAGSARGTAAGSGCTGGAPPTRQGCAPEPGPRWDLAPPPAAPASAGPDPTTARGRTAWLATGAVAAIVTIVVWSAITVFGTVAAFAQWANPPLGCVGGVIGLASIAAAVVGAVSAAAGALRRHGEVGRAWACVAATLMLTLVMAGFGAASS